MPRWCGPPHTRAGWSVPPWPDLTGGADGAGGAVAPLAGTGVGARLGGGGRRGGQPRAGAPCPRVLRRAAASRLAGCARLVVSVVRYLLRTTSRATPFGLFAGVAPAGFGPGLAVRWGEDHRAVARVDAVWLAGVVAHLEACPELLRRLPVVVNNLCFVRERTGWSCPASSRRAAAGRGGPAEVSVRHTKPVATVVRAARSPVLAGDLVGRLAADFPAGAGGGDRRDGRRAGSPPRPALRACARP